MKRTLTLFSILTITALPALAAPVSGRVLDENGDPLVGAHVFGTSPESQSNGIGAIVNGDGIFTMPATLTDDEIIISFIGYKDKTVKVGENLQITMEPDANAIEDVVVITEIACNVPDKMPPGVKHEKIIDNKCYPDQCITPRWQLRGNGKNAKCVETNCKIEHGTGEWVADGDSYKCTLNGCDKNYKENHEKNICEKMATECSPSDKAKLESAGASDTGIKRGTEICIPLDCKCGYDLVNEKCEPWATDAKCGTEKKSKPQLPANAISGLKKCSGKTAYCEVIDCANGFRRSDDKKYCISTNGEPCDATKVDQKATAGTLQTINGTQTCVITNCAHGFSPNKSGTQCIGASLTEEQSKQRISELQENAQKMRDKETSTANKLLGAAGMGATGIGGMQVASALAEQNADADAETAMRAYLATFHCNYGDGKNIAGGTKNVEIPGGNELIGLYSEYVNLANNLKMRKTALGLRPGIESEPILDSATSGLYDDVSTGITSGAYASLARALQNPDGPDAIAWAAQKDKTKDKLKTGAIVAGVGALGSLAGNLAINSGAKNRERSAEINAKYDALRTVFVAFEQEINNTPPTETCEKHGATGTWPNCTCPDIKQYFSTTSGQCIPCENGGTFDGNNCVCGADQVLIDNKCTQKPQGCKLTGFVDMEKCQCKTGATGDDCHCDTQNGYYEKDNECKKCELTGQVDVKTCTCTANTININGRCEQQAGAVVYYENFKADALFITGKSTLTDKAKAAIKDLITNINKNTQAKEVIQSGSYCITITGHTDRTKFRPGSSMNNQKLSENRANAVKAELISASNRLFSENNIKTYGKAESECTTDKYPKANDENCRRVNITITVGKCGDQPSQSTDIATAGTNAGTSSAASNELIYKKEPKYEHAVQVAIKDAKRNEITQENIDTALENILNDHNIEPTDELKQQWRTYATKCRAYKGIFTLKKWVKYDGYKATYYAECLFPDYYTTLTKKDYDTQVNDMGATSITGGVFMKLHITQDDTAILIK